MGESEPTNLDLTEQVLSRAERLGERVGEDRRLLEEAGEREGAALMDQVGGLLKQLSGQIER